MEFWGVEVKGGEPLVVEPEDDTILHISQACLAEVKKDKGNEPVFLYAKIGDQKLVLGILSSEKFPQISLDLVFEKTFELSHNWKNGSVHFTGYRSPTPFESNESDSDDDMALIPIDHEKSSTPATQEVKNVEVKKEVKSEQTVDSSDSEESGDEKSDDDQGMNHEESSDDEEDSEDDDGSEDESENSEEEEEETPEKASVGKKRHAEFVNSTPVADKKARLVTPEKTGIKIDGKKVGGHTATPYPKQVGKKAANSDQSKQKTAKSGGAFHCNSCNRSFNSEVALQSHTKAKHGDAK